MGIMELEITYIFTDCLFNSLLKFNRKIAKRWLVVCLVPDRMINYQSDPGKTSVKFEYQ